MEFIERWLQISSNAVTVVGVFLSLASLIVTLSSKRAAVKAVAAFFFLFLIVGSLIFAFVLASYREADGEPAILIPDTESVSTPDRIEVGEGESADIV